MPTLIGSIEGKQVVYASAGDSFAFLLGQNMKGFDDSGVNALEDPEE